MPEDDAKQHRLIIERLDTVGFVDAGMNPEADITIWKRKPDHNPEEDNMPFDPKTLSEDAQSYLADLKKQQEEALAERDALIQKANETLEALKARIVELEASDEGDDQGSEEDDVLKGLDENARKAVEAILAKREAEASERIEALEKRADAAFQKAEQEREARLREQFRKQAADDLDHLQGETEDKAMLLFTLSEKLDKDTMKGINDMLRAANAQVQKSTELLSEIGEGGQDDDPQSPWNQVLDKAKQERERNPELTHNKAVAKVLKENPKLAAATRNR